MDYKHSDIYNDALKVFSFGKHATLSDAVFSVVAARRYLNSLTDDDINSTARPIPEPETSPPEKRAKPEPETATPDKR